jgi:hypothetical protein
MGRPRVSQLVIFSALPFLLLSSARTTSVRTTVYLDGTVQRQIQADFEDRERDVLPELKSALPHADRVTETTVADGQQATRGVILANADDLDGVSLEYLDIAQEPLSLFTHYTFKETLTVPSDTATDVEKAGLDKAVFEYRVTMPGRVLEATAIPSRAPVKTLPAAATAPGAPPVASPAPLPGPPPAPAAAAPEAPAAPEAAPAPEAGATPDEQAAASEPQATPEAAGTPEAAPAAPESAELAPPLAPPNAVASAPPVTPVPGPPEGPATDAVLTGSTATWTTLSAAHDQYDITVTSRRLRWGYVLTLLYILAFVAYKLTDFLLHRARLKPKRI